MKNLIKGVTATALALFTLTCTGCGTAEAETPLKENLSTENLYVEYFPNYSEYGTSDPSIFNATITSLDQPNSWDIESNTNPDCIDHTNQWYCKRAEIYVNNDTRNARFKDTKFTFTLNVEKWTFSEHSPYWVIVFQDWRPSHNLDSKGVHPITTLKVKQFNSKLYLGHYNNSWQWGYDFHNEEFTEGAHHLHQENTLSGITEIKKGIDYEVEIYRGFYGYKVVVNNETISDVAYKTTSFYVDHEFRFGMYWNKTFNKNNNPNFKVKLQIKDFKYFEKD